MFGLVLPANLFGDAVRDALGSASADGVETFPLEPPLQQRPTMARDKCPRNCADRCTGNHIGGK